MGIGPHTKATACCAESLRSDVFAQLRSIPAGLLKGGALPFRADQEGGSAPRWSFQVMLPSIQTFAYMGRQLLRSLPLVVTCRFD